MRELEPFEIREIVDIENSLIEELGSKLSKLEVVYDTFGTKIYVSLNTSTEMTNRFMVDIPKEWSPELTAEDYQLLNDINEHVPYIIIHNMIRRRVGSATKQSRYRRQVSVKDLRSVSNYIKGRADEGLWEITEQY